MIQGHSNDGRGGTFELGKNGDAFRKRFKFLCKKVYKISTAVFAAAGLEMVKNNHVTLRFFNAVLSSISRCSCTDVVTVVT